MKRIFPLLILIFISCSKEEIQIDEYSDCRPSTGLDNSKADAVTGLIEFDIIPDKNFGSKGAVLTSEKRLWPDATIPYYFLGERGNESRFVDEEHKNAIRNALKELESQTGLNIPEYESQEALLKEHKDGVYIIPGIFFSSAHMGRQGGLQSISITFDLNPGTIKHEMLHTIGFAHEFSRSDRDEYIKVVWDNMHESHHRQFDINPLTVDCGEFDIESVMMYGPFQITGDEEKPIILTINGELFEKKEDLSPGDIATVKAMYNLN